MSVQASGFSSAFALVGFIVLVALGGLFVLSFEAPGRSNWRARMRRWVSRLTGQSDFDWVDPLFLTAVAVGGFALVALTFWSLGGYECAPGPPDLITNFTSGRMFLTGGDPFSITACGVGGNPVPQGFASILLNAMGSLGGPGGVLIVWGSISVAIIPLLWAVGGPQRRIATVYVLASFLYFPIVAVQVDGATLALVPFAVLLVLNLARRGWRRAAAVGGFLATGRFPALFPILGASGRAGPRRWPSGAIAIVVFAAITIATFLAYGSRFIDVVFFSQFSRLSDALNYWGILEGEGWILPSTPVTIVQAALTLVAVGIGWRWAKSELGAVSIVLTATILLTQFLSFTELVFLVPVALVGTRPRWWLWGIGVVASINYLIAMRSLSMIAGLPYALDLLLTALALGLWIDLIRSQLSVRPPAPAVPEPQPARAA